MSPGLLGSNSNLCVYTVLLINVDKAAGLDLLKLNPKSFDIFLDTAESSKAPAAFIIVSICSLFNGLVHSGATNTSSFFLVGNTKAILPSLYSLSLLVINSFTGFSGFVTHLPTCLKDSLIFLKSGINVFTSCHSVSPVGLPCSSTTTFKKGVPVDTSDIVVVTSPPLSIIFFLKARISFFWKFQLSGISSFSAMLRGCPVTKAASTQSVSCTYPITFSWPCTSATISIGI